MIALLTVESLMGFIAAEIATVDRSDDADPLARAKAEREAQYRGLVTWLAGLRVYGNTPAGGPLVDPADPTRPGGVLGPGLGP
jgi:hypothetical protein